MIPDEVFKRRRNHNNTPPSILLIITNFIVVSVATSLFCSPTHINWFFWVVLAALAVYNYFNIRRNRELFNKTTIIAYCIGLGTLFILFFVFKGQK